MDLAAAAVDEGRIEQVPEPITARTLDELIDRAAILDVITTYVGAMDRREWDLYRSTFLEEIDLDFTDWLTAPEPRMWADDWVALVRQTVSGFEFTQHMIANPIIRQEGGQATVDAHMTAKHIYTPDETECLGGLYTYRLVRGDDGWKLSSIRLDVKWDEGPRELFARAFERGSTR